MNVNPSIVIVLSMLAGIGTACCVVAGVVITQNGIIIG